MATYTVFADPNDYTVGSENASLATAFAGSTLTQVSGQNSLTASTESTTAPYYYVNQSFLQFDCSGVPPVGSSADTGLGIVLNQNFAGTTAITAEIREYAWPGGTTSFRTPAQLAALTLFGTLGPLTGTGVRTFPASGYVLPRAINKYILLDQGDRLQTTITPGQTRILQASATETAGTASDPYLTVFVNNSVSGLVSATEANDTPSITGVQTDRGQTSATEANDTAQATGHNYAVAGLSAVEQDDVSVITGAQQDHGGFTATEQNDTLVATFEPPSVHSQISVVEQDDVGAGTGVSYLRAGSTITEADDVAAFTGTSHPLAQLSATEQPDVSVSAATIWVRGLFTLVEADDTSQTAAAVRDRATFSAIEQDDVPQIIAGSYPIIDQNRRMQLLGGLSSGRVLAM